VFATATVVSGWYFAPNLPKFGRPFVTSFESTEAHVAAGLRGTPTLDRRPLGFVFGWDEAVYRFPYWPTGLDQHPRFFPIAIASSFVDYWSYSFSGIRPETPAELSANGRPLTRHLVNLSRGSMLAGTVIAAAVTAAWAYCLRRVLGARRFDLVALLLVPFFTLIAALEFAIRHPYDGLGVIKGVYLQFGMPPLLAAFGIAVEWSQKRRSRWPVCAALLASLALVSAYTLSCRTGIGIELPLARGS
jgi:hypothetical protein